MTGIATVGVVGSGPAAAAIEAALEDVDAEGDRIEPDEASRVDAAVVTDVVGAPAFGRVNRSVDGPWIAVELGGIGGRPVTAVDTAISGFGPDAGCFDCLRRRVASTTEPAEEGTASEPAIGRSDARLAGAHAGRRLVSLVAGDGNPTGTVVELPYAERRLLAAPGCACGAAPDRSLRLAHADVTLEGAIDRAEGAIDERIGIVSSIGEVHSFPAPYYLATLCDTSAFGDAEAGRQAGGVALDWNEAFMKATGEALERYAAGVYRETWFTSAPAADLDRCVPPDAFVRPDGYRAFDAGEAIDWVAGEELATGAGVHLPAEFVQFPPPDRRYKPSITTGLGLGASPAGALRSGLYEVIERDATMLAWYSTFEPLELEIDDPGFETLASRARSEALSVTPLLVTQDVDVPVVAAAVHRDGEWPRFAIGSSADLDPAAAARGALCEALQNWMELRDMGAERAAEEETAIDRYADLPPAVRDVVDPDGSLDAATLAPDPPPDGADELDAVIARATDAGLTPYAARITTRDVEALGFEAVRVLVPEAQPLFTGERYFGERARRVPRELGFRPRLDRGPHPYP